MELIRRIMGLVVALSMVCGLGCVPDGCSVLVESEYEVEDVVVALAGNHDSTLEASRSATFRITSTRMNGKAVGTATLFKYRGEQIVVTAAHVVRNALSLSMESRYQPGLEHELTVIYYDDVSDIAILMPSKEIRGIKPIKLRAAGERHMGAGTKTIYSGYPNNHSLLTIHGRISGYTSDANLILDTYGWSGASGSAVFDENGRLLGVLSAMDIGYGLFGQPELIPDVIIIIPTTKIDFDVLDLLLDK